MNIVPSKTQEESTKKQPLRPLPKDPPPNDDGRPNSTSAPTRTGPQQPKGPPPPEVLERSAQAQQKQPHTAHSDDKAPQGTSEAKVPHEIAVAQMALDNYAVTEFKEKYTLIKKIGKGAYGAVYIAHEKIPGPNNTTTVRKVAIKHIINAFVSPTDARRIYREIKVQAHFSPGHPNILPLLEVIKPRDPDNFTHIYLVSELMETDLHRVIRSRQDLTSDHISYFIYQSLCALKHIHAAGVLHRDLKPSNLLVNADCTVKMCDFGLARESDSSLSQVFTEYVVTRWYRAPEVLLSGGNYTSSIDVWSVGCILGELLLRRPLFPGENYLHQLQLITEIIGSPSDEDLGFARAPSALAFMQRLPKSPGIPFDKLFPHVRGSCLDLLRRMLAFNPDKRLTVDEALEHPFFFRIRNARKTINEDVPHPPPFRLRVGHSGGLRSMTVEQLKARFHAELCGVALTPTPSTSADIHISFVSSLEDGPVKKIHEKIDEKDRLMRATRAPVNEDNRDRGIRPGGGDNEDTNTSAATRAVPQAYTTTGVGSSDVIHNRYGMGAAVTDVTSTEARASMKETDTMDLDAQSQDLYETDDEDIVVGETPQSDENYPSISPDTLSYLGGQSNIQPRWAKDKNFDSVEDLQRVLESAGLYPDDDPFGVHYSSDDYDSPDWNGSGEAEEQMYQQRQSPRRLHNTGLDEDDSIIEYNDEQSDMSLSSSPSNPLRPHAPNHKVNNKRYSIGSIASIKAAHYGNEKPVLSSTVHPSTNSYPFSNAGSGLPNRGPNPYPNRYVHHPSNPSTDYHTIDRSRAHSLPSVYPPPQSTTGPVAPPGVQNKRHSGSFGSPLMPPNRHHSPLRHYPTSEHIYPSHADIGALPRPMPRGPFGYPPGNRPVAPHAPGAHTTPFYKYTSGPVSGMSSPPRPHLTPANVSYQSNRKGEHEEISGQSLHPAQNHASSFAQ